MGPFLILQDLQMGLSGYELLRSDMCKWNMWYLLFLFNFLKFNRVGGGVKLVWEPLLLFWKKKNNKSQLTELELEQINVHLSFA